MQPVGLIAIAAAATLANVMAQVISHRVAVDRLVPSLAAGFGVGVAVFVVGALLLFPSSEDLEEFWWHLAAGMLIYVAGSFTFLCLVAAGETSVRVEILRQIGPGPDGKSQAELDAVYDNRILVRTRLNRLLESGMIRYSQGRYRLESRSLLLISRLFLAAKIMMYGVTNEFGLPPIRSRKSPVDGK